MKVQFTPQEAATELLKMLKQQNRRNPELVSNLIVEIVTPPVAPKFVLVPVLVEVPVFVEVPTFVGFLDVEETAPTLTAYDVEKMAKAAKSASSVIEAIENVRKVAPAWGYLEASNFVNTVR